MTCCLDSVDSIKGLVRERHVEEVALLEGALLVHVVLLDHYVAKFDLVVRNVQTYDFGSSEACDTIFKNNKKKKEGLQFKGS